jgi:hypothetical protein
MYLQNVILFSINKIMIFSKEKKKALYCAQKLFPSAHIDSSTMPESHYRYY